MAVESRLEFFAAPACFHSAVDLGHEPELPALHFLRGAVFARRQFCASALVRIEHRQLVRLTYIVAQLSQLDQSVGRLPEFLSVNVADRVDDEMRMYMFSVAMSSDQHFVIGPRLPRELKSDLMSLHSGDVLVR